MTVQCDIVSAEREIFSGLVEMVVAHGTLGDLGVYPGHTPLLTQLDPGPVRVIRQGGKEEVYFVSGGFLEVQPSVVTVLADVAVRANDVDEAAAQAAMDEAKRALANQKSEMDYSAAASRLAEAATQLRAIQQIRKKYGNK
ncbi:ATPase, delta/epsilon subunit [gamma proteobacterium HdN1]|nr:ATPase, delta/epsilon subunit [gamma proteobacterium HdN1]